MLCQIDLAPTLRGRRSEHEPMRTSIVGNELRSPHLDEVRISRVGNLDRRMHRADGIGHFVDGKGLIARLQRPAHTKRKFRLSHAHQAVCQRTHAARLEHRFPQDSASQRPVDSYVRLAGNTGGGDLPSVDFTVRPFFQLRLNGETFRTCDRPQHLG